jgi:hypothetical protein
MRWTMMLADEPAATTPPAAEGATAPASTGGGENFHALMILEGTWSGDRRWINEGVLTWRDLPLPLMGLDVTTEEHQEAVVIGSFTRIERIGNEIHGWGTWATGEAATRIRGLIRAGHLRGISADLDDVEAELHIPDDAGLLFDEPMPEEGEEEAPPADDDDDDDTEKDRDAPPSDDDDIVIPLGGESLVVKLGRIMGATVVPFPAFQEAFIEDLEPDEALAASGYDVRATINETRLPSRFFTELQLARPTPFTVTDDGEVSGECVTPPHSLTDYAMFHTGEVALDNGDRIAVGHLAVRGGHADLNATLARAQAHYDDTRSCVADLIAGEDEHGIWVHGAIRPEATAADVRAAMASGVSGDWRWQGAGRELIHLSSVNVPGFNQTRARYRESGGQLVASIIDFPPVRAVTAAAGLDDATFDAVVERMASTVGLSRKDRLAALQRRLEGAA